MESTNSLSKYLGVIVSNGTNNDATGFPDSSVLPIGHIA